MLNEHQLAYYKELYDGHDLIHCVLNNQEWVFRSLTPKEYQTALLLSEDEDSFEDGVCQTAVIYPEHYDFLNSPFAGVARTISPYIMEISSYTSLEDIFDCYDKEKQKANRIDVDCMNLIKAAMPEVSYEEMESWTWQKIMKYVVRAEKIMALRGHEVEIKRPELAEGEEQAVPTVDDMEFVVNLLRNGIDPMMYFKDQVRPRKSDLVESPFIGGIHWKNEGVLDAIRKQMATSNH